MRRQDGTVSRKLRDAIPTRVASSSGAVFALILLVAADTHNPLPTLGTSFFSGLTTHLSNEESQRYGDQFAGFLFTPTNGATHGTNPASLTATPITWSGYTNGGWYLANVTGSVIYQNDSTCWLIAHEATTGNLGSFSRVGSTHYLTDCRATSTDPPELPNDSLPLLLVTTAAGGISSVTDLRPFGGPVGVIDALDYEDFESAVADAGTTYPISILVRSRVQIEDAVVVPANVTLVVPRGGLLEILTGASLTLNSPPNAGRYLIFPSGSPTWGVYAEVYPEWWGAIPGDANDDAAAIETALMALPWSAVFGGTTPVGGVVSLAAGNYRLNTTIEINEGIGTGGAFEGEKALVGQGERATVLSYYGSTRAISIHALAPNDNITGFRLADFALNFEGADGVVGPTGIYLEQVSWVHISHLNILGFYDTNPGVVTFENSSSQVVDVAASGYGIQGNYLFNAQIEHSRFSENNVAIFCGTCNGDVVGPSNSFYSGGVAGPGDLENFSIVLDGPLSGFRIEENLFEAGDGGGEGEIFIWDAYEVSVVGNRFENCEATTYVYANDLGSFRNHGVTIDENYFSLTGTTKRGVYMRSTTGGSVSRNVFTGPSLGVTTPGPDIELGPGASRIVMEGNEAFLTAALGALPLPQAGDSRSVTVKDTNSAALAVGTRGAAYGQVGNTGLYVPGAIVSARGGIQEARVNLASQSSFENGTASVAYVGAAGGSVGIPAGGSGWHSSESVYGEFPLASTTDADRIEFNNTSVTCAIGDYFTVSFAAANNVGTTVGLDDITFQMEDSEDLGSFTPQLDNFWNRYWFITGQCQGVGAVELRAFQNTAQTGALRVLVDAVQVERNVSSAGTFIATGATGALGTSFEGLSMAHGGLVLAPRIEPLTASTTFDANDGSLFVFTNTGAAYNVNPVAAVSALTYFPVGWTGTFVNVAASTFPFVFDSAGAGYYVRPGRAIQAMWTGSVWEVLGRSNLTAYTQANLAAAASQYNLNELVYCTDCTPDSTPCVGGGAGALAVRIAGPAWNCS